MYVWGNYETGIYQRDPGTTTTSHKVVTISNVNGGMECLGGGYADSDGVRVGRVTKKVGIGVNTYTVNYSATNLLTVGGSVGATAFNNTSDIRLKDITEDTQLTLDEIADSPLFKFKWNNNKDDTKVHVGSSAQYWKEVLPEAVNMENDEIGTLSIQYGNIALASVISLAREVRELKAEIAKLKGE